MYQEDYSFLHIFSHEGVLENNYKHGNKKLNDFPILQVNEISFQTQSISCPFLHKHFKSTGKIIETQNEANRLLT